MRDTTRPHVTTALVDAPGTPSACDRAVEPLGEPGATQASSRRLPWLDRRIGRVVQPFLLALILLGLLFPLCELLERTWLAGAEVQTLEFLRILRDILASLLIAGVLGWVILKTAPRLLVEAPQEVEWNQRSWPGEAQRIEVYARWFIAMRWVAVLLAGILVFISVEVMKWLPPEVWWPLALTITALAGCNLFYVLVLHRGAAGPRWLEAQACLDLVFLTVLLHFSGGIENLLWLLMIFHVIIAGILLPRRRCYWIAGTASLLFALLAWSEWSGLLEHYTLRLYPHAEHKGELHHPAQHTVHVASSVGVQMVVLFLAAYFVTTLAERVRQNERRLDAMAHRVIADRQLFERALQTAGAGLRVLNPDMRSLWFNEAWNQWFVCETGETCAGCEVLDREDSPARQCLQDGRVRVTELVLDEANCPSRLLPGETAQRVFQVTTAPLLGGDGKIDQVVELAQDITAQKKIQAQILQAGKLAAIGELAGQVAHEVNNPISIISAKASLLLADYRSEVPPKVALELSKMAELAKRVARIAQGLLSYCRPSAATRVQLDLGVPIRKSLSAIEEQARRAGVRLEDQLPDRATTVRGNPQELEQVFLNLFLNSLDAMPKGGWLSISLLPEPVRFPDGRAAAAVEVKDTGCGIPEEIREKIFEPFFTTKREGRGTGLGLSICLGLIRSHGGELEIESKLWQGTRVMVKLPLDAPALKEEFRHV